MNAKKKIRTVDEEVQAYKQFHIDDYGRFVRKSFGIVNQGEVLQWNWHIGYIADILAYYIRRVAEGKPRLHHLIFNIPPRSLKTYLVSMCLPAWAWLIEPSLKFVNTSYSSSLSIKHNVKTKRLVESRWYQSYSDVQIRHDQNQKILFENTDGGSREATSTGGSITGSGGNIIIIDDPQNPKMAASDLAREETLIYFDETLTSRLNRPDIDMFIIVMQRLHEEDLTGHVLKKKP